MLVPACKDVGVIANGVMCLSQRVRTSVFWRMIEYMFLLCSQVEILHSSTMCSRDTAGYGGSCDYGGRMPFEKHP